MNKCDYKCKNNVTCTIPIFFELINKDNTCPCNECIVKVKCVTPCSIYKDEINSHIKEANKVPGLLKQYIEYRKSYLQSIVTGYTINTKIPIVKADTILNPSNP